MKKILWIILILIILFVLFLWLMPNQRQHAQIASSVGSAVTTADTVIADREPIESTNLTQSGDVKAEKPLQLDAYVSIQNAYVVAPPPGSSVVAAYMQLFNSGRAAVRIVSIESDDFDEMMFHRTVVENGIASMEHMDFLEIPSAGSLLLEPNGLHIMAMDPERELKAGDQIDIHVTFDNGKIHRATLPVR